jgi:hypothetical protein
MCADESTPPELLERMRGYLKNAMGPGQGIGQFTPTDFRKGFENAGLHITQMVKHPPTSIAGDLAKAMGWIGLIRYMIRASFDLLVNSELRKGALKAAPVKRIMERNKDTKKFFGYVLIVAQK